MLVSEPATLSANGRLIGRFDSTSTCRDEPRNEALETVTRYGFNGRLKK